MKMKITRIMLALGFVFAFGFFSCSKCYDCEIEYDIISGTDTTTETQTDEICTASQEEVDQKEDDGWTCVSN